jgi:hypothetical protein
MKRITTLISVLACLIVFTQESFAKRPAYSATSVVYVTSDKETITMRATATGASQQEALNNAEQNAVDVILFRGVPESTQKMALVGSNESAAMMENNPYFTEFYSGGRYKSFITNSTPVGGFTKLKGKQFQTIADVKVNFVNLRRDLEQAGVVRKFGF